MPPQPGQEPTLEPTNSIPYNEKAAISGTSDVLGICPGSFTQFKSEYQNVYIENGPQLDINTIPTANNTFENQRFLATQSNRPMNESLPLPGNDYLFTISSLDSADIWELNLSKEDYLKSIVEGTNKLKRALSLTGKTEIQYSLPNSETIEISLIPFDPNGSTGGTGTFVRSILKERHRHK